jgi:hypothetical protein
MVAHATPPAAAARVLAEAIAWRLIARHMTRIKARRAVEGLLCDSPAVDRFGRALLAHLTDSVQREVLRDYAAGIDMAFAVPLDRVSDWIDTALDDAVAAAKCP